MRRYIFPIIKASRIVIISIALISQVTFAQDGKAQNTEQGADKLSQTGGSQGVDEKAKESAATTKARDIIKENKEELSKPDEPQRVKPLHDSGDKDPDMLSLALPTIVILVVMLVCYLLFRRFLSHSRFVQSGTVINVLAKKQLSSKHTIYLVEVGRKIFLIGQTKDALEPLGEFSNPDDIAILRAKCPWRKDDSVDVAFRDRLNEGLREYEREQVEGGSEKEVFDNLHGELEEIRKTVNSWRA